VDFIRQTDFYGIPQIGEKDRSLINEINPTFIVLTKMAIHHCLSDRQAGEFTIPPEFDLWGAAQYKCDTRNIHHMVNNACTDEFHHPNADFLLSLPQVQATKIDNISRMNLRGIHSTGTDPVMAQPHYDQGNCDEDYLHYILEELLEQPDNSFNHLSGDVAATEASMRCSAVVPMGRWAIASSSRPIPCSDSHSNSNGITYITNITSVEYTRLVDGSTTVEGVLSLGG